jgi:hypothetical protein
LQITISEVVQDSQRKAFVDFPHQLYADSPYWVPPLNIQELTTLDPNKNPVFDHAECKMWMAFEGNVPLGRIAAIINHREIETIQKNVGRLGWVDFVDVKAVSKALFTKAETWLKSKGMDHVKGPYGFTNFDKSGLLTEGFEELPTIVTQYNYAYYASHFLDNGFERELEWFEYQIDVPREIPERINRLADTVMDRYGVRSIQLKSKSQLKRYADQIFALLMESYSQLDGFIPYTKAQTDYYIKTQIAYIRPDFVSLILNESDELVAFGITMPSLSRAFQKAKGRLFPWGWYHILKAQKYPKCGDLLLIAVHSDYRNKGLNALIFRDIMRIFIPKGIEVVETNPELDYNQQVHSLWQRYEPRLHKKRNTYIKAI